ncbi:integral membrane protein [Colletotrichum scovillei]|nr:integral membrane protein [Colletotrichum scovillei]KAG7060419.1 integral membrane protein [Colletotrichum scovillei]
MTTTLLSIATYIVRVTIIQTNYNHCYCYGDVGSSVFYYYLVSIRPRLVLMGTHLTGYGTLGFRFFRSRNLQEDVLLDVLVCGLPLPWAWQHAAQKRSIYGVVFLFVLGNIVVAISISRLVSIINTAAGTYPTLDPSWYGYVPAVLATVEVTREFKVISEPRDFRLKSTASSYDGGFSDRIPISSTSSGPTRSITVQATSSG